MANKVYQLTEEQKRVLSPESQQVAIDAMTAFYRDILNNDGTVAEPMPPGKADFPPLGIGMDDEPPAT